MGYDDDDLYDDYSEEEYAGEGEGEGMSAEDKEQMAAGVIKVREALGSEYKVKEVDIQDALWNYYYDVGKSVTFLKSTRDLAWEKHNGCLVAWHGTCRWKLG